MFPKVSFGLLCCILVATCSGLVPKSDGNNTGISFEVPKKDKFTKYLQPERLQPFYLIPIVNSVKVVLTFMVTGFDIKFPKEGKTKSEEFHWGFKEVAKHVFSMVPLLFIALNGYFHDFKKLASADGGFSQVAAIWVIHWVTSANYGAALAIWGALGIQNPGTCLKLTPKYKSVFGQLKFPLSPFGSVWLKPLKWLYAVILLPYILPEAIANWTIYSLLPALWACAACCACKCKSVATLCALTCVLCKACCCCIWPLIGMVFTLFLVKCVRDEFVYSLLVLWHFFGALIFAALLQVWAVIGAPALFTILFGLIRCFSCEQIMKVVNRKWVVEKLRALPNMLQGQQKTALVGNFKTEGSGLIRSNILACVIQVFVRMPEPLTLDQDDANKIICFDAKNLEKDFHDILLHNDEEACLQDSKLRIILSTMCVVSGIMLKQYAYIFIIRYVFTRQDLISHTVSGATMYNAFSGAFWITLTERSWHSYVHSLMDTGAAGLGKVSSVVDMIWNLV